VPASRATVTAMVEAPFVGTSGGGDAIAATVLVSAVRSKLAAIAKLSRDRLMANPPLALCTSLRQYAQS
jgi:hypothetical protein